MPDQGEHVAALFEAAVSLDPGQRSAFLDRACGDNASLRQEVEELLQADTGTSLAYTLQVLNSGPKASTGRFADRDGWCIRDSRQCAELAGLLPGALDKSIAISVPSRAAVLQPLR